MSGEFRAEQNTAITATNDPDLARQHGLTSFNKRTGQYELPTSDVSTRDGVEPVALVGEPGPEVTDLPEGEQVKPAKATGRGSK